MSNQSDLPSGDNYFTARPPIKLREKTWAKLEAAARSDVRKMNEMIAYILERYFESKEGDKS